MSEYPEDAAQVSRVEIGREAERRGVGHPHRVALGGKAEQGSNRAECLFVRELHLRRRARAKEVPELLSRPVEDVARMSDAFIHAPERDLFCCHVVIACVEQQDAQRFLVQRPHFGSHQLVDQFRRFFDSQVQLSERT